MPATGITGHGTALEQAGRQGTDQGRGAIPGEYGLNACTVDPQTFDKGWQPLAWLRRLRPALLGQISALPGPETAVQHLAVQADTAQHPPQPRRPESVIAVVDHHPSLRADAQLRQAVRQLRNVRQGKTERRLLICQSAVQVGMQRPRNVRLQPAVTAAAHLIVTIKTRCRQFNRGIDDQQIRVVQRRMQGLRADQRAVRGVAHGCSPSLVRAAKSCRWASRR